MTTRQFVVADYMQTKVATVEKSATFKEALDLMLKNHTNGLVVTDGKKVAGILSSMDIIRYVVPDYLEDDKHLAPFEAASLFAERVKQLSADSVEKFMTAKVYTVPADGSLMEAATMLAEYRVRQLPVVDAKGNLAGYINRTDIKRAMGEILNLASAKK